LIGKEDFGTYLWPLVSSIPFERTWVRSKRKKKEMLPRAVICLPLFTRGVHL
jgi:hypothetical protein